MTTDWVGELVRDLRGMGYQVPLQNGGYRVIRNGDEFRMPGGLPLVIHATPSASASARKNTITRLIQAKVLEEDPRTANRKRELALDPAVKEARLAARKLRISQAQNERLKHKKDKKWREQALQAQDETRALTVRVAEQLGTQTQLANLILSDHPDLWGTFPTAQKSINDFVRRNNLMSKDRIAALDAICRDLLQEKQEKQEEKQMETAPTTGVTIRLPYSEAGKSKTTLLHKSRFEEGKITITPSSVSCDCGHVILDSVRDRRGRPTALRAMKAHIRAKHVYCQCPECEQWMSSNGIDLHTRAHKRSEPAPQQEFPEFSVEEMDAAVRRAAEQTVEQEQVETSIRYMEGLVGAREQRAAVETELMIQLTLLLKWVNVRLGA